MKRLMNFLLLEDNRYDATLTSKALKKLDIKHNLTVVNDEKSFFEALERDAPDMVFCDYQIPNYSGLSAFRDMKERGYDMPFILITGILEPGFASEITKMGMNDYVLKDELDKLPTIVKRQLVLNDILL